MDTALTQKFPFILDRNLAKANCTENQVCTSCDIVVLGQLLNTVICVSYFSFEMVNSYILHFKYKYFSYICSYLNEDINM